MVAISLYRGNLHRVPDVPRQWLLPAHRISLKEFRVLLSRRSKALTLLPSSSSSPPTTTTTNPNPNPNPNPNLNSSSAPPPDQQQEAAQEYLREPENPNSCSEPPKTVVASIKVEDAGNCEALDQVASLIGNDLTQVAETSSEKEKGAIDKEKAEIVGDPVLEGNKVDAVDEKEKRKREVEEKLQILNEKKHSLVQALKQILNAEEELKRRSNMQATRAPLPLQVDVSNDSGSMTRHATPRTGSEANITVHMEGGEGDDALNHNIHSRQLLRMSSTSPSAESALKRPPYFQHNAGSHPSRAATLVAGSPSRFAPSGNPSHPSNLPTVSVSGTNYIASSPSPAASGGTSVFRDARHPSPWN